MIIIPVLILATLVLARIKKGMFAAFLVLVATKSIVDMFWDLKFGPLSMLAIQGVMIPFLFLPIFRQKKHLPKYWLNNASIYLIALSFGLVWGILVSPLATIEAFIININIYLGFLLIPLLIRDKKHLKQFLLAMMLCGVFPILVSMYQLQTGVTFQDRQTIGLTRYVGLYHDAFPVRFYGLMSLMSILVYQFVFRIKGVFLKGYMLFLSAGAFLSVYLVFSKAAVAILGLWVMLLLIFSKSKIKQGFSVLIGLAVIFLVFGDAVSSNIEQLFSKEVGFQNGEFEDIRYTLAGRGYIWDYYWQFWTNKQSVFFQWVGDGLNRPAHNEFLRVLLANGIIGILFLVAFIFSMIRKSFKIRKTIKVFGLMVLGMYIIDSLGLVPGVYYYYNILIWGIFGLLLIKPQLFIKSK
jgi:O-antigen ligase